MRKRVLLLAVSCKNGGLCPGGIDLDNPTEWIRIVRDDGHSGAVQRNEIAFAKPFDVIEFEGRPRPQGKQRENWVIDNNSCIKVGMATMDRVVQACREYGYHGFWNNNNNYLREDELARITVPSESILFVTDVDIYKNNYGKAKIDFRQDGQINRTIGVSLTDQDFYAILEGKSIHYKQAIIVISIPKDADWKHPDTGEPRAYKFVSKVIPIGEN